MIQHFELLLFSTNPDFVVQAVAAGVDGIIVDWEYRGKEERQAWADTQINRDTLDDLHRVRASTAARVLCRLNSFGPTTPSEVEQAIAAGADEVLLPMVRSVAEVQALLDQVAGRSAVGILVETEEALQLAAELAQLPLARVFVGLNDLAIQRDTPNIFTAILDGTVERVRRAFRQPFGFAGLTRPDRGYPIPCRLLVGEMARLHCDFSFLRRSFLADVPQEDLACQVPRIRQALTRALSRSPEQITRDQADLHAAIAAWKPPRSPFLAPDPPALLNPVPLPSSDSTQPLPCPPLSASVSQNQAPSSGAPSQLSAIGRP